jgi:hypothetical protein
LTDVAASGNAGDGIRSNRVVAKRLTATGNAGYGAQSIYKGNTKLVDSSLTGNGVADVGSQGHPRLVRTTCDVSRRLNDGGGNLGTWGVCAAD